MSDKPIAKIVELNDDDFLSQEQENKIIEAWNSGKTSIEDIGEAVFGYKIDIRSKQAFLIKEFIANKGKKIEKKQQPSLQLSEEQRQFVDNNKQNMGALQIARILFNNKNLTALNKETRLVVEYYNSGDKPVYDKKKYVDGEYSPPCKIQDVISIVKENVPSISIDIKNLTSKQRQELTSLMSFLGTMRFIIHANAFEEEEDRKLFISEFVRCCYDKPDLSEEEVDQYIVYSNEVIISKNILKSIDKFQKSLEESHDSEDGKKLSMTLVEMIGKMRDEYNQSIARQTRLLSDLKGTRSKRIERQGKDLSSVNNLVQAWKDETFRAQTIHLAELKKQSTKEGIEEISDMDEFKARVFGLSKAEAIDG